MIDIRALLSRLAGGRQPRPKLSREQLIERGHRAQAIIGSSLWGEAWTTLAEQILDRWQRSRPDDVASRELCYTHLAAAASVRAFLETAIKSGAAAAKEIEGEMKRAEKAEKRRRDAESALGPKMRAPTTA